MVGMTMTKKTNNVIMLVLPEGSQKKKPISETPDDISIEKNLMTRYAPIESFRYNLIPSQYFNYGQSR